jgi:hypothetical protein
VQCKFRVFHLGADQGNKQPWHPSPEKILREYRNLPLALRLYFEKRDIRVSSKPAEKPEDGVVVTLEGDVSEGVLEKALEQFLIALNNAPMGSPDPICYGAVAI